MLSYFFRQFCLFLLLISLAGFSFAEATKPQIIPRYDMQNYDKEIFAYFQSPVAQDLDIKTRVVAASQLFLGKKYLNGSFGEGPDALIDKSPLYRTDAFDCLTYVSLVLALVESNDLNEFQKNIKKINYKSDDISHGTRNHFTSIDWNPKNIKNGFIQDITTNITNNGHPIVEYAQAEIDRPAFFRKMGADKIKLFEPIDDKVTQQLLNALHAEANQVKPEKSKLPYLPLTALFNKEGQAQEKIFNQIPNGSIIEIVRPNWDIKKLIGTNINVSHLGLAIRNEHGLMYREASSDKNQVVDIPLTEYLKKYLNSPTVKGINVQVILPRA